jgi:lysophospholipase L1-like esterase
MTAIVDISAGFFMREYRLRLAELARQTGSIFVPAVLNGILTNPSMKSDFMHPNAHGYKIVAQRVYCAIKPYLQQP